MRRAGLIALLVLLVPAASASANVSFAVPAVAHGQVHTFRATWVLVAFEDGAVVEAALSTSEGSHQESITETMVARGDFVEVTSKGESFERSEPSSLPPFDSKLRHEEPGGASLFVQAENMTVEADGVAAKIQVSSADACAHGLLDQDEGSRYHDARYDQLCPKVGGPFLVLKPEGPSSFRLLGARLHAAEWHNLQATCSTAGCPSSSYRDDRTVHGPYWNVTTGSFGYTHLDMVGESRLEASGVPRLVAIGGPDIDLAIQGWLRMPQAVAEACATCVADGATVSVSGAIALNGLRPSEGGRLEGVLGGDLASAQVDEARVDPLRLMGGLPLAGAATVAAATLVLLVKVVFGALFTRLSGETALEHPNRRRLVEQIAKDPGINFRALVRASGIAAGTARHHLTILVRAGVVTEQGFGATRRFFAGHVGGDWEHKVLLREPGLRHLFDWVAANPGATQMEVLDAMAVIGWSRSTTQHRLLRLGEAGALHIRWQGRYKRYWTDPAQAAAASLPQVSAAGPGSNAAV